MLCMLRACPSRKGVAISSLVTCGTVQRCGRHTTYFPLGHLPPVLLPFFFRRGTKTNLSYKHLELSSKMCHPCARTPVCPCAIHQRNK